jgi:hypothetical protein
MSVNPDDIVYKWKVQFFSCYPTFDNYKNVIFQIHGAYIGTYTKVTPGPDGGDPITTEFTARFPVNVSVNTDDITDFVPFDQITYEMTAGWIESSPNVDMAQIKATCYQIINDSVYPPPPSFVNLPPPF